MSTTRQETDGLDMELVRRLQSALNELGEDVPHELIRDVDAYLFKGIAPADSFVAAIIQDSLYDAAGRAPVAVTVCDILRMSRFVRIAIPESMRGGDGYRSWIGIRGFEG